jgi:hypothetical protein
MEEIAYYDDWSVQTTKVDSVRYLLKCLRYMKLDENEGEDDGFKYIYV